MSVQIVEIGGQKMAMLPIADYERLVDIAEDKADALAAAEAERRRKQGEEYLPASLADRIMAGESALKAWRRFRGLTLGSLAAAVGTTQATLSRIETGKMQGRPSLWRALAEILNVSVDDILPAN